MKAAKFYAITNNTKRIAVAKPAIDNRSSLEQLPEVAIFQPKQPIWYLRMVGLGHNRKIVRFEAYVERPLRNHVLIFWKDNHEIWHQDRVKPCKIEERIGDGS